MADEQPAQRSRREIAGRVEILDTNGPSKPRVQRGQDARELQRLVGRVDLRAGTSIDGIRGGRGGV